MILTTSARGGRLTKTGQRQLHLPSKGKKTKKSGTGKTRKPAAKNIAGGATVKASPPPTEGGLQSLVEIALSIIFPMWLSPLGKRPDEAKSDEASEVEMECSDLL